jgi:uncharacterized protein
MNALANRFRVIDVDTHVVEPYDLWTARVPEKYGDLIPHVRWDEKAECDAWYFGDARYMVGAAAPAMAGWPEHPPYRPKRIQDVDPATWRAQDRLKRMDEYGIWAQVLYPNVVFFGTETLLSQRDPELMLACITAYNDWQTEWASADPTRFYPQTVIPFWDLDASLREIDRCVAMGHKGLVFTGSPEYFKLPRLGERHWEPLWSACEERGLPINFHVGGGDTEIMNLFPPEIGRHAVFAGMSVLFFLTTAPAIVQIIASGVCHRHPKLNFVSVESGVGWLPFLLESMDWQWQNCGVHKEHPEYGLLPSEFFKRQIYGAFWFERNTLKPTVDLIGADNLLFETDFPHPTSMSPGPASIAQTPRDYIGDVLDGLPEDAARKILHDNAARIYHLD